ncbi:MAG TPA: CPBP family intramembrane glutamic endopeptidase [Thermoanaerobaculia bacterium]|nr:CPBP family intramembrane glutamic endopeptidase [Thermoanaerobaculia bacterium]
MMAYAGAAILMTIVWGAIIYLNETRHLLSCDRFPTRGNKYFAYAWLGVFLLLLGVLVANAANNPARASDLARTPFYALFSLHLILVMFLVGWWIATGRPHWTEFLNIQRGRSGEAVLIGLAVGVGGWIFTIMMALLIAAILSAAGMVKAPEPSPVIGFMAMLPVWKKALLVLSAMTVEEAFFRAWLQKRIGLVASTTLFTLAHFTLGQPLLLIGVAVISLVIGFTFYRTKNVLPGVVAHGVFDAVQLFVIIPIAFKVAGL